MRKIRFLIVLMLFFVGCAKEEKHRTVPSGSSYGNTSVETELATLREKVRALELFAGTYTAGVENPFGNCDTVTVQLEKLICQIAKTAMASEQAETKMQLATMAKEFQNTIYGADCVDAVVPGCPVAGSLMSNMAKAQSDITSNKTDITAIQGSITSMQAIESAMTTRITNLENRLNAFNGTAQSLETIITGIQTDVSTLKTDVANLKGTLAANKVINQYLICGNNADSGPIFEILLVSGDKTKAYGSLKNGTWYGMGLFFSAGNANAGFTTHLNSKACNFKMYNNVSNSMIQACWVPTNRSASNAQIDAARTAGTATCTDY